MTQRVYVTHLYRSDIGRLTQHTRRATARLEAGCSPVKENLCGAVQRAVKLAPPGYIGKDDRAGFTKLLSACLCTACTRLCAMNLTVPGTAVWCLPQRRAPELFRLHANMARLFCCVAEAARTSVSWDRLKMQPAGLKLAEACPVLLARSGPSSRPGVSHCKPASRYTGVKQVCMLLHSTYVDCDGR